MTTKLATNETMQCAVVERIGSFRMTERPVPLPGPGEVLLKVEIAGLCRTDLKIVRVGHRDLVLPRIPAEEVVGHVREVGPGVERWRSGDRVYVYPGVWCGDCPACRAGAENLCRHMRIMGFHRDGGFAGYVLAPAQSLIAVPAGLASEAAVFAEPLSCCLNALELGRCGAGQRVGIWGAGPAGTLLARAADLQCADVTVIEPDPRRRARASGVECAGDLQFDLAVVAVGSAGAYADALVHLAPRGTLVVFSGLAPDEGRGLVDANQLHYLEQTLVGAYGCCFRHGEQALQLLAGGDVQVADLITHRLPLRDLGTALDLVEQRGGLKILIDPNL